MQRRKMLQGALGFLGWAVTGFGLLKSRDKPAVPPDPVISTAVNPPPMGIGPYLISSVRHVLKDETGQQMLVRYGIEQKVTPYITKEGMLLGYSGVGVKGFLQVVHNYRPEDDAPSEDEDWQDDEYWLSNKYSRSKVEAEAMIYDLNQMVTRINQEKFRRMNTDFVIKQMSLGIAIMQDCLKQQFLA